MLAEINRRRPETPEQFRRRIGDVPTVRSGAFDKWVDARDYDDVFRLWAEFPTDWNKIGRRIRGSKRMHEWLMVQSLPELRKLSVPMEKIRGIGFGSPTKTMRVHRPGSKQSYSHFEGTARENPEAAEVLSQFHQRLGQVIKRAADEGDVDLMYRSIGELAEDWLDGGVDALPQDLLEKVRRAMKR